MKKIIFIFIGISILAVFALIMTFDSLYSAGGSMEPTFKDEQWVYVNKIISPKINDVVAFACFTDGCINNHGDTLNGKDNRRMKRLIKINDRGCYWFEGDNKDHSWDSRNYGYLCPPDDVKIIGVVVQ